MGPILAGIIDVAGYIFQFIKLLVLASVIVSWVGADPSNPIVSIIRQLTEPLYRPFQPLSRKLPGPLDWSPMLLLLLIIFLESVLNNYRLTGMY